MKDAEISFEEMNSVRIIRGILNIQAYNPILVVPPNAISKYNSAIHTTYSVNQKKGLFPLDQRIK